MICEPDEPKDETDNMEGDEPKKGHGGCGAAQPQIRKEGLKLFVQYKRSKDEDEVGLIMLVVLITFLQLGVGYKDPPAGQEALPSTRGVHGSQEDPRS